jgi:hypothetical protein
VQAEGEDSLKKMQLMELAILNGTYRDANIKSRKNEPRAGLQLLVFVCWYHSLKPIRVEVMIKFTKRTILFNASV